MLINFDNGVREYEFSTGGVLRFCPSDPAVYSRLMEAIDKLQAVETNMVSKGETINPNDKDNAIPAALKLLDEADKQVKEILRWVFGASNDFDAIIGTSSMSIASNGERVLTNFINAILPEVQRGAEIFAESTVNDARKAAEARRALQIANT